MRTTLNIDDALFEDLLQITRAKTKTQAVREALGEFIRLKRKEALLGLRGKLQVQDNWQQLRALEIEESSDE